MRDIAILTMPCYGVGPVSLQTTVPNLLSECLQVVQEFRPSAAIRNIAALESPVAAEFHSLSTQDVAAGILMLRYLLAQEFSVWQVETTYGDSGRPEYHVYTLMK